MAEFSNLLGYDVKDARSRNAIDIIQSEKYILIGDSYNIPYTADRPIKPWGEWFKQYLELSDSDCYISGVSGSGFVVGETFQSQLEGITVPESEKVKHIIVCGGYNDMTSTTTQIMTAINNFCDKAKELYPNAMVHCGFIGHSVSQKLGNKKGTIMAYSMCKKKNYHYMTNIECVLYYRLYMLSTKTFSDDDGNHPNMYGNQEIANQIILGIKGCCNVQYAGDKFIGHIPNNESVAINGNVYINNGIATIVFFGGILPFENPLSLNFAWSQCTIASFTEVSFKNNVAMTAFAPVRVKDTTGVYHDLHASFILENGGLHMKTIETNSDGTGYAPTYSINEIAFPTVTFIGDALL